MDKKVQIVISLVIPYLVICSVIWHISFWSTFDFNFLPYLGLTDLILSFVYPFILSMGIFFINYFLAMGHAGPSFNKILEEKDQGGNKYKKRYTLYGETICSLLIILYAFSQGNKIVLMIFWVAFGISGWYALLLLIYGNYIFIDLLKSYYYRSVFKLLLIIPFFSAAFAKLTALNIYNNSSVNWVIVNKELKEKNNIKTDSLKYISSISNVFVLSTKNNDQLVIVSKDAMPIFVINKKN